MSDLHELTTIRYCVFALQCQTAQVPDRCPAGSTNARLEIPRCYLLSPLVPWSTSLACESWFVIDIELVVDATGQECCHSYEDPPPGSVCYPRTTLGLSSISSTLGGSSQAESISIPRLRFQPRAYVRTIIGVGVFLRTF